MVVVEGSSDAKVADAVLTTSVQQHVCVCNVTVNGKYLRVQLGQTPCNVRQHKNSLVDRQRHQGTDASARQTLRQTVLQATNFHQGVH